MLIVVSPAKKLNKAVAGQARSKPAFPDKTSQLLQRAQGLKVSDLQKLMRISENLAKLNAGRFADFVAQDEGAAMHMFAGDTYQGLDAASLDEDEIDWAQDHLRILSGLYGLLRPLDAMRPYRLEMGSRLQTEHGRNLYDFWGSMIADALNQQAHETGSRVLINCASEEYFGAVDTNALSMPVITPVFMEEKPEGPKIVSFYAKRARGAMTRFIIQRRLQDIHGIQDFDTGGYRFQPDMSDQDRWVFIRPAMDASAA